MKDLRSKEHYCYKIHILLMKTSAYLLFDRQLMPPAPHPYMAIWATPYFYKRILIPPKNLFYKNSNCHISKWGGGGHTINITYDLLKQSYNGEMDEGYI